EAQPRRQLRRELLVPGRLRPAKPVLEVQYSQPDAQFVLQLAQKQKQRHRIRAARYGHTQPLSSRRQPAPLERFFYTVRQRRTHWLTSPRQLLRAIVCHR